jgi:hypothetical protein
MGTYTLHRAVMVGSTVASRKHKWPPQFWSDCHLCLWIIHVATFILWSRNYGLLVLVLLLLRVMVRQSNLFRFHILANRFLGLGSQLVCKYITEFVSIFFQLSFYPDDLFIYFVLWKAQLSLCLINEVPRHEDVWGSEGIAPLDIGTRWRWGYWSYFQLC